MPAQTSEFLAYLNQFFNLTSIIFHTVTILFTSHLLYCVVFDRKSLTIKDMSSSLMIFITTRLTGAVIALPHEVYLSVKWSVIVQLCQTLSCVLSKYKNIAMYMKLLLGVLSIFASCFLMRALSKYAGKSSNSEKVKNQVVKVTMLMELFLDVIPLILNQPFLLIAGNAASLRAGSLQFVNFLIMLNVAMCSVYYSKLLIIRTGIFASNRIQAMEQPATETF
ncbi:hypothetical protein DdX_18503 [Ditylenchus destructor]|uniref:Uncharacterized protein n=1 Tax=Ditylenchus destructor TaxID=166010 RepID=A0AAD4MJQ9_9BILA|nr:hypothetical protein DdX_18503 [Ditylenchus destructor]